MLETLANGKRAAIVAFICAVGVAWILVSEAKEDAKTEVNSLRAEIAALRAEIREWRIDDRREMRALRREIHAIGGSDD